MSPRSVNRLWFTLVVGVVLLAVAVVAVFAQAPGVRDGGLRTSFDKDASMVLYTTGRDVPSRAFSAVTVGRSAVELLKSDIHVANDRISSVVLAISLIVRPLRI